MRKHSIEVNSDGAKLVVLTFDDPEQRNPLTWEVFLEFGRLLDELDEDDDVRVVAVTGDGPAFSAGGDLKAYAELQRDVPLYTRFLGDVHRVQDRVTTLSKPVIALVNGTCVAGGFELLLRCDAVIAAESALIGDAHLNVGQIGGGGVLALLPRIVGPVRSKDLLFSGRLLRAQEALDWGLVQYVVPDDELLDAGRRYAVEVAKKSPLGVATVKRVLGLAAWGDATSLLAAEREATTVYVSTSHDAHEGLLAFAEKRRPDFKGR